MDYTEKRKFTRVPFRTEIMISTADGTLMSNSLKDISLGGAFVCLDQTFCPGTRCNLQIDLIGPATLLRIVIESEVMRVTNEGMGLNFVKIDIDSLVHLKHFIKLNSQNPDQVEQEFSTNLLDI